MDKLRKLPNATLAALMAANTLGLAHAAWNILSVRLATVVGFLAGCLFVLTLGFIAQPDIDMDE